ncbi:hypothetical protein PR048_006245 [Dryococelus australis]|uniref:Reverse transcriptase domain-containing protein n=1 Tax=Dryococelus australis TaxID=614101 RepID=A0ABQ9IAF0_9NEOP|nr:hypothetical protein PR048_006245 [Dryococelus australis]
MSSTLLRQPSKWPDEEGCIYRRGRNAGRAITVPGECRGSLLWQAFTSQQIQWVEGRPGPLVTKPHQIKQEASGRPTELPRNRANSQAGGRTGNEKFIHDTTPSCQAPVAAGGRATDALDLGTADWSTVETIHPHTGGEVLPPWSQISKSGAGISHSGPSSVTHVCLEEMDVLLISSFILLHLYTLGGRRAYDRGLPHWRASHLLSSRVIAVIYMLGSPLVDDRPIMNAVKYRALSGVVWTNSTTVSSNTDTNRTSILAVMDIVYRLKQPLVPRTPSRHLPAIRVTCQQHVGTQVANQRPVPIASRGSPASRETFVARSSQSDTKPDPEPVKQRVRRRRRKRNAILFPSYSLVYLTTIQDMLSIKVSQTWCLFQVYTPTGFEKYSCTYNVGDYRIHFVVWDTSGAPPHKCSPSLLHARVSFRITFSGGGHRNSSLCGCFLRSTLDNFTLSESNFWRNLLCTPEPQIFVHWLLPHRVANVTPHLAVWHSLLVFLQVCHWLRVVQGVSNELCYPRKANSYRPITLLPVMGKTLERLVNQRLMQYLDIVHGIHPRQYGFMKGKSTEMAILDMVDQNMYELIQGFLTGRKCAMEMGTHREERGLIRLEFPQGCEVYGYADDGLLLVPAWSRKEHEEKTDQALKMAEGWAERFKMDLSVEKINAILLKGNLKRNPMIRFRGRVIRMVTEMKYLGVILESRLAFHAHVRYAMSKAVTMFYRLRAVASANWGLGYRTLKLVYNSVFLPILTYACGVWYPEAERVHGKRVINSAQRAALLGITKAYRTSSDALQLIAGEISLDLLVTQMGEISRRRRRGVIPLADLREITEATLTAWQTRWDLSNKCRQTHGLFRVFGRDCDWRSGLNCPHWAWWKTSCVVCGMEDTSTYALECPKVEDLTNEFEGIHGPLRLGDMLRDRNTIRSVLQHLTKVGKRREEFDVWWSGPWLSRDLNMSEVQDNEDETGIGAVNQNG